MRIGIDFDGVMNDMLKTWCEDLSKMSKIKATSDDITEWDLTKTFTDLCQWDISSIIKTTDFWMRVEAQPGAVEYIKKLIDDGHDVVVVTAAWPPESLSVKFNICMQKYFPFINWRNVISTGRKDLIDVDILIDDYLENLKESHSAIKILFRKKYNDYAAYRLDLISADDWADIYDIIRVIAEENEE